MIEFDGASVGKVIKRLRTDRKLSQEVLSGFASLGRSHLAMIESGKKQANFETVWKIANVLGMAPHELVELIEREASAPKQ